jgi:hypothetical protein
MLYATGALIILLFNGLIQRSPIWDIAPSPQQWTPFAIALVSPLRTYHGIPWRHLHHAPSHSCIGMESRSQRHGIPRQAWVSCLPWAAGLARHVLHRRCTLLQR